MLASIPASILNQMFAPLGIPRDSDFKLDALEQNLSILNRRGFPKSANSDSHFLLEDGGQQEWPNPYLKIFEPD
jgi:hypothetical protein